MLTKKQYELLMFIEKRLRSTGISPSFDEMKDALDLKSKSGIHRLITGLEERGFIRRLPHRARALEILRLPENTGRNEPGVAPNQDAGREEMRPNVIRGQFSNALPGVPTSATAADAPWTCHYTVRSPLAHPLRPYATVRQRFPSQPL